MRKVPFTGGSPLHKKIHSSLVVAAILAGGAWTTDAEAAWIREAITPMIKLGAQWDSNFFRTKDNEVNATTYLVQPGLTLDLKTPRSYLALGYTLDSHTYDGIEEDLDFIGHTLDAALGSQTTSGKIKFDLTETYRLTRDPLYLDPLGDSVSRQKYAINNLSPKFEIAAGLATAKFGYRNVMLDYSAPAGEDSTENGATVAVAFKMGRLSSVGAEYGYTKMEYDLDSTDYSDHKAKAIFSREGKAVKLTAGLGWMWRDFDQAAGAGAGTFDKFDELICDLSLGWQSPGQTSFTMKADYGVNSVATENSYYEATKLALDFAHKFGNGTTLGLNGQYQYNDYKFQDRTDNTWQLGTTLLFPLARWLDLAATAGYQSRNSSLDLHDYDNTSGQIGLNFKYPIGSAGKDS